MWPTRSSGAAGPRQLVIRFAVPTFLAFLLVGVVIQAVVLDATREHVIEAREPAAVAAAELLYRELREITTLDEPQEAAEWLPLSQVLPYQLTAHLYLAATVWRQDGTILWASQPDLVGHRDDDIAPGISAVLSSQEPRTRVLGRDHDDLAAQIDRTALVVDVPVGDAQRGPQVMVRVLHDYAPIAEQLSGAQRTLGLALAASLAALFVVTLPIAAGAGRALQRRGARLREAEQRFRDLAEQSPDGILRFTTADGPRCEYANPAVERLTGGDARAWDDPGTLLEARVPDPGARRRLLDGLVAPVPAGRTAVDVPWTSPEGDTSWLSFHLSETSQDGDRVVQAVVMDVTHRHLTQQRLEEAIRREQDATARLRELDEMKNAFLRAVSHELRTPLTSIIGASRTLQSRGAQLDAPTQDQLLESVVRNADRLHDLLRDLLDVDRLTQGVVQLRRTPTDLAALARRVVEMMDVSSHPIELDAQPVTVAAHAASIERIIENLVGNAIKHTTAGTPITVGVEAREGGAVITVVDEGEGIPPEIAESVFQPFVQGPASRIDANPGAGIGLALVDRLTTLHGGRVELDHGPAGGTRFRIHLPDVDRPAPER